MSAENNFTHRVDGDGVLHVVFDTPGQKVNLLNEVTRRGLDRVLEEASHRDDVREPSSSPAPNAGCSSPGWTSNRSPP